MNKIIMDAEHYHHATAVADSFDLAINDAVAMLASQIMTNVRSEASSVIKEHNLNGEITSSSYFSNVVKTFTDVRLTDYHVLMVGKPTKKTKTYTAFVYISSKRVAEIIEELKQAEIEAAIEREKQLKNDISFYYDEGLRAINDIRIGDALKYFYWGYLIASDTKMVLERNGNKQPADAVFSLLLDQTLSNITIICEGQKDEKINEAKKVLAYEVTKLIHGQEEADKAVKATEALFGGGADMENVPTLEISEAEKTAKLVDVLTAQKVFSSKREARQMIAQRGLYLNNAAVEDAEFALTPDLFAEDGGVLIRKGKKKYYRIVVK